MTWLSNKQNWLYKWVPNIHFGCKFLFCDYLHVYTEAYSSKWLITVSVATYLPLSSRTILTFMESERGREREREREKERERWEREKEI